MTELGQGTNVKGLETTATYNQARRTFTLHTPTATSAKWWTGGAGKTATKSVIFAQLVVGGESKGVHVFYAPLRDRLTMDTLPGVTCGDIGHKAGINSIDNGFIIFDNYEIPYDNLFDAYGRVDDSGVYQSHIANPDKRFGA
jgi:acyl-CoA oxidase